MLASIVIIILAILFGSLSIFTQYIKDRERRKKIERAVSIPAALALYGLISWLMSHTHQLDNLGILPVTLEVALVFFLLIPTVTYIFSPAFKDGHEEDSRRPQSHTSEVSHP
jgi:hypothetical protein